MSSDSNLVDSLSNNPAGRSKVLSTKEQGAVALRTELELW